MSLVVTAAFAFSLWIFLWGIGAKSFDGFLLALVIILVGAGVRMLSSSLPGNRTRD
jgi:hypothetical protein